MKRNEKAELVRKIDSLLAGGNPSEAYGVAVPLLSGVEGVEGGRKITLHQARNLLLAKRSEVCLKLVALVVPPYVHQCGPDCACQQDWS